MPPRCAPLAISAAIVTGALALNPGRLAFAQSSDAGDDEAPTAAATAQGEKPSGQPTSSPGLPTPRLSGYLQAHFRHAFETGNDGIVDHDDFRVQRARVGIEGEVLPWISYDIEIDPRAPELRGVLRDAFIAFKFLKHKLRFGQQKMQFGYENRESSSRLFAVNRTEVSDNLSRGVNLRDVGIGLIGKVKLGAGFRFEDALTVGNGAGLNVQADDTAMKNVWGRLGIRYKNPSETMWARLGVSGGIGDMLERGDDLLSPLDDFRVDFKRLGVDLEVDHKWFFVSSEYVLGWDKNAATGETDEPNGYYVNVVGKSPWDVGPIARYDVLGDEFARWTFGAYYGPAAAPFRVMVNYEYRRLKDGVRGDDKLYVWTQVRF